MNVAEYPDPGAKGNADTTDPSVRVSSVDPTTRTASGARKAAVAVPQPQVGPLRLKSEPRIETYEATKPTGEILTVTHNLDSGATSYEPTGRRAFPLPELAADDTAADEDAA